MTIQDYTRLSDDYDAKRYVKPSDRFVEQVRRQVIFDLLELNRSMRVADVATGTGRGALALAPKVREVIGIDATPSMLDHARAKAASQKITNVQFVTGDAFALDFPDHSFDVVISLNFLHLFHDVDTQHQLVSELTRICKPGGQILFEIDNALLGGVIGVCRKYLGRDIGYNWPWQIKRISGAEVEIEKIGGANLPGLWRLHQRMPQLVRRLEAAIRFGPLRWFASRFMVVVRKPAADAVGAGTTPIADRAAA